MQKMVKPRAERDRSTNIEIVRKNCNLSAENDIIVSLRLDKNAPRVITHYSDNVPLNVPFIPLEDIPTDSMDSDSQLGNLLGNVEETLAKQTTRNKKDNNDDPKNVE